MARAQLFSFAFGNTLRAAFTVVAIRYDTEHGAGLDGNTT